MFYPLGIPTCLWMYHKILLSLLAALFLNFFGALPVIALSDFSSDSGIGKDLNKEQLAEFKPFQGVLQEVPPPVGVEKIRKRLTRHKPELSLLSPSEGDILLKGLKEKWELVFNLKDWPLVEDPKFGLGTHLVVQIDEDKPMRISYSEGERIVIEMDGLTPGTHRIGAYLAFPWGEALKEPGTNVESRINFFEKTEGTQPKSDQPWLTVVSPSSLGFKEPLLIDALIWNAPLQGLKEGDDRWRLKISMNGDSFLMDRQEALWVQGIAAGTNVVKFELLDGFGEAIEPVFNNQVRLFNVSDEEAPIWQKTSFSQNDLFKLIGETDGKEVNLSNEQMQTDKELLSAQELEDRSLAKYELIFPPQSN